MEHNRELLQQIKEDLAKECGWKDFRTMAENVNIVPHDVSYIAKRYAEKHCEDLDSKLHLLQQEYEALQRWKEEAKVLLNPIFEYAEKHPDMKIGGSMTEFVINRCKEYDKLKANYDHQVGINLGVHKEWIDLKKENAALKEKAEKMAEALEHCAKPIEHTDANLALYTRQEIAKRALSSYNSNTPKSGVYIGNPKGYCHECGFPVDECNCESNTNNQNENNG